MMHQRFIALFTLALTAIVPSFAQNLVLNPSFEDYTSCPTGLGGLAFTPGYIDFPTAKVWVSPLKQASPDYFNGCGQLANGTNVPDNSFGYQLARTGKGYAGIIAWESEYQGGTLTLDYSEYLQCRLASPLQAGEKYCVTFYVNAAVNKHLTFNFIAIDEIGVHFSNSQISLATGYTMNLSYDIINPTNNFLNDTIGWMKVTGVYIAKGGEEWMTLGRFTDGTTTPNIQTIYPSIPNTLYHNRAYLYVDDVSVFKFQPNDTTITVQDSNYCVKSQLPMTLVSSGYDGTFLWNTGATTKAISATQDGVYWCTSFSNCHTYIDTFRVQYKQVPKLNLGKKLVNCNNEPIVLDPKVNFDNYIWSTGATTPSIIANKSGTYTLTASNICGTQFDSVQVFIQPPTPKPIVSDTTVCQFAQPQLKVQGTNILWYANPAGVIGSPLQPALITVEPGYYDLYVTQTIGACESAKETIRINVKYTPHEELEDREVMCSNDIQLIGKDLGDDISYKWNTGDIECCIRPEREGNYKVAIRNTCGVYIDTVNVAFSACEECIIVPNAFTPNGDRINDEFAAFVTCPISEYSMKIYNRWGQLLYETTDVNKGWNGAKDGVYVDNGVYIYMIEYRAIATKRGQFLKGNITLMR